MARQVAIVENPVLVKLHATHLLCVLGAILQPVDDGLWVLYPAALMDQGNVVLYFQTTTSHMVRWLHGPLLT